MSIFEMTCGFNFVNIFFIFFFATGNTDRVEPVVIMFIVFLNKNLILRGIGQKDQWANCSCCATISFVLNQSLPLFRYDFLNKKNVFLSKIFHFKENCSIFMFENSLRVEESEEKLL